MLLFLQKCRPKIRIGRALFENYREIEINCAWFVLDLKQGRLEIEQEGRGENSYSETFLRFLNHLQLFYGHYYLTIRCLALSFLFIKTSYDIAGVYIGLVKLIRDLSHFNIFEQVRCCF